MVLFSQFNPDPDLQAAADANRPGASWAVIMTRGLQTHEPFSTLAIRLFSSRIGLAKEAREATMYSDPGTEHRYSAAFLLDTLDSSRGSPPKHQPTCGRHYTCFGAPFAEALR